VSLLKKTGVVELHITRSINPTMAAPSIVPGAEPVSVAAAATPEHVHVKQQSAIIDSFASLLHPVAQPLAATFNKFHNWKENMGLIQPGTVENLTRDVTRKCASVWACERALELAGDRE
jgi:mitochondrial import receptor subunit TOM40